jgi:hypothetical protein
MSFIFVTSLNLGVTHFWRPSNQTTLCPGVIYNWRPSWVGPANKFLAWKRKPWAGWKESSSSFNSENVDSLLYMSRPVRPATLQYTAEPGVRYSSLVCYSWGCVLYPGGVLLFLEVCAPIASCVLFLSGAWVAWFASIPGACYFCLVCVLLLLSVYALIAYVL